MGYQESYRIAFKTYKELLDEYEKITEDPHYAEICENMPFQFLEAKHKAEMLELYKEKYDKHDAPFKFTRADEAITFFRSIIDLRKNINDILEDASVVVRAGGIAKDINNHVDDSPFLPNNLKINENDRLMDLAKNCLEKLPEYPSLMTSAFRISFLESCIENLTADGLKMIIKTGYMNVKDMENIRLNGSDKYEENILFLQKEFGIEDLIREHHNIRLAGTSKKNEDGTSRQEILKKLSEVQKDTDASINLSCEKGKFKPEVGKEVNSVAVNWNDKTLGYVPQAVVDQMFDKYEDPQFKAKSPKVIGGGSVNYGCEVDLGIVGKEINKEEKKTEDNEVEKE